jgi:hypothetical protein
MASRFESTYQERVLPAAFRAFGQSVDLISADDATEYRIDAMVSMDPVGTEEGFSDVQGNVTVKTADFARCVETIASASKCRHKGQIFDVYGEASEHCGLTVFNIRRKHSEQDNTNLYDISGNQTLWQQ